MGDLIQQGSSAGWLDAPTATLLGGMIGAAVTMLGWITLHYLTVRREQEARTATSKRADRLRRLEISLKRTESQIGTFYGPLYALIQHIWRVWEMQQKIRDELKPEDNSVPYEGIRVEIDKYIWKNYYKPLHDEIRLILKERLDNLEGSELPDSFNNYLRHATLDQIQNGLWEDRQIGTQSVAGIPWDYQFPKDVKAGLDAALSRYEKLLEELRRGQLA